MVNEIALRDALLSIVTDAKGHYIAISSLNAEIEALRETAKALDPTFLDVMEQKTKEIVARDDATVRKVVSAYDHILQRLKDGEVA